MNKILLAFLAATVLMASQAEAGDKPRRNGYHGGYENGWKPRNRNVYKRRNVYNNYNYKYNNNNNGWYAFGGFLGGLALGGVLAEPGPVYGGGGGAYYYDQPDAQCTTIFERRWNAAYEMWENIPHTVCGGY